MATKLALSTGEAPSKLLEDAFERFTESSMLLQEKYELLSQESEALRQQLKEKDKEIERATKLATLGETAAAMAHEIRNPLGAIKLFTSLLRSDIADKPDSLDILRNIDDSINSLDHVVSNILQFSKNQKPSFGPLNLHAIIQEQIEEVLRSRHNIKSDLALDANPFLRGNDHALRQLFRNLFINAAQAMKSRGSLIVKSYDCPDNCIEVLVKDAGPGIPEELLSTIFEPFITSKNEGTGLGLAIVKQIVDQHDGNIIASNRSDHSGAVFIVRLPRQGPNGNG